MGAWGTSISSNDTYADVYESFFNLYNDGLEIKEISQKLISDYADIIGDPDDSNNFWFALAKAQWECKKLDSALFEQVKRIVESGSDLEVWRRLDADEKDIRKRKIVLEKFLTDLQLERPKAKGRKKKVSRQPAFNKGDCLTFNLSNGNFGGAVVLEADYDTGNGYNLIATTRINQPKKPAKDDFVIAEVMVVNFSKWEDTQSIRWIVPQKFKTISQLFEKVASVEVENKFNLDSTKFGYSGDLVGNLIELTNNQFESEITKARPTSKNQTIKNLIRKNKWNIW